MFSRETTSAERRQLRSRLAAELPTDADLDAFCMDHCPVVKGRFTSGMDRLQKTNLLLELQSFDDITGWLNETPHAARSQISRGAAKKWRWLISAGLAISAGGGWFWMTRPPFIIESDPPGAEVLLMPSQRQLGRTPLRLRDAPRAGEHIRLQMRCYADSEVELLLKRDVPLRIRLKPLAVPLAETPAGCPIHIRLVP